MKPGSSHRCKARHDGLRCHRATGHDGLHQAPRGTGTVRWDTFRDAPAEATS